MSDLSSAASTRGLGAWSKGLILVLLPFFHACRSATHDDEASGGESSADFASSRREAIELFDRDADQEFVGESHTYALWRFKRPILGYGAHLALCLASHDEAGRIDWMAFFYGGDPMLLANLSPDDFKAILGGGEWQGNPIAALDGLKQVHVRSGRAALPLAWSIHRPPPPESCGAQRNP